MKKVAILLIGEIKYDGRVQKEIKTFKKNRYEVTLIVSKFINDLRENYDFDIYSLNYKQEKKPMRNLINKFKFCKEAFLQLKLIKPDIIHCNDLDTLYAGHLYKKIDKKVKLVYDAHELFPESQEGLIRKIFWNIVEMLYIKDSDEVVSPEVNRAKYMKKKYKLKKVNVIENFPINKELENLNYIEHDIPETQDKYKILYLGEILPNREIETIISCMKKLKDDICLVLIGKIRSEKYKKLLDGIIEAKNLKSKVFFLPPVENKFVINYINSANIGLVFYKNTNLNNYYCASNKLYEFINCNKKVITNDYPGLKRIINGYDLGICLNKINEDGIIEGIHNILRKYKNSNLSLKKFYWEDQEDDFLSIYLD